MRGLNISSENKCKFKSPQLTDKVNTVSVLYDLFYLILIFFRRPLFSFNFSFLLFSLLNVFQFLHVTNISASSCETESHAEFLSYIKQYKYNNKASIQNIYV